MGGLTLLFKKRPTLSMHTSIRTDGSSIRPSRYKELLAWYDTKCKSVLDRCADAGTTQACFAAWQLSILPTFATHHCEPPRRMLHSQRIDV
ncbi:hypothetical protein F4811DRAFT_535449 [Daldinia bambusicola]|nr:hypothetical protein F4811DRAFT_535449 [Daldinia bambusicola]